ncbi:MAG: alpha/beta fold hydrolase [Synechococcaceae bacterium WB9_4xC_028]|nr:alpha/beta fold hydrolase [Synechococcaceae bacterium WB9_4xC_028]
MMRYWLSLLILMAPPLLADEDQRIFDLGDFSLEVGITLPAAKLSYTTHGKLNAAGDNAVLVPSFYLGDHHGYDFLIGPGKALDPAKYFIVATDMFQNGLSSSPSNTPAPYSGNQFPPIAIRDNVSAQLRLLTEELGVSRLRSVIGFSMGAQQAFQWAVSHPDFVETIVPMCGSAVEHPHGIARLESFKLAIKTDAQFLDGNYSTPPTAGLRSAAVHWAAWAGPARPTSSARGRTSIRARVRRAEEKEEAIEKAGKVAVETAPELLYHGRWACWLPGPPPLTNCCSLSCPPGRPQH